MCGVRGTESGALPRTPYAVHVVTATLFIKEEWAADDDQRLCFMLDRSEEWSKCDFAAGLPRRLIALSVSEYSLT